VSQLSAPPINPIPWVVEVDADTFVTAPYQTAFAAAASVRTDRGVPAFSECRVWPLTAGNSRSFTDAHE